MKRNIKDTSKNDRKFRKREELYRWSVIEMKEYLAHIRRDESAVQTIRAHLLRVGDLMASYAEKMELSATARLAFFMILGSVPVNLRTILITAASTRATTAARERSTTHRRAGSCFRGNTVSWERLNA